LPSDEFRGLSAESRAKRSARRFINLPAFFVKGAKTMKILLATDGSDFSRAAIEKLCRMIVNPDAQASIKVVSVYGRFAPIAAEPFAVSAAYYAELETEARRQSERFAEEAAAQIRRCLAEAKNVDVSTLIEAGTPHRVIVEEARRWGADLIVVGSHGHGFWERALLGSTSDGVIHHAPCSVLVVRQSAPLNGRQAG
jgi:nucleotide-binding universal stress UspA family protein